MREKHKKTSENAGTRNNFRAFTERWTLENMRFLEFPWIRRLGKYKKTGENFCERGNALCFPYVNRALSSGKQCVFRNFTAFAVPENKGKRRFSIVNHGMNVKFYTGKTSVNTGKQDIRQVLTDR